jgi:hypothetical protein
MHTLSCPVCHLRFTNTPTLDFHVREDHAPPAEPERRETLTVEPSPLRRARAREQAARVRALTWS